MPTVVLLISKNIDLFDSVKRSPFPSDLQVIFCQPDDDYLALVQGRGVGTVLLDWDGPEGEISPVLKKIKKFDPLVDVLILSETLDAESIIGWIRRGATDYIPKPVHPDEVGRAFKRISEKRELRRETFRLEKKLEKKYAFQGMISRNPSFLEIFSLIEKISKYFASVLITGETGTGKEMVAKAIHGLSPYAGRELVVCDCASIPESLFESELFGYKRGAFTGAEKDKKGLFEEAHRGIIFLDEIAEIPVSVQAKLLRVLESHKFRPLGSNENASVDVRIIAATNRDLGAAVQKNEFREDLFHRLNKIEVHLPPLRERLEDIPLLVRHFLGIDNRSFSKNLKGVSREVHKIFLKYGWPGNVRELENVLASAAMICQKDFIDVADLPKYLRDFVPSKSRIPFIQKANLSTLEDLEKEYIMYLLKSTRSNLRQTAKILGISRTTLYNKMAKYGLSR